jgi:ABC transporter substrate binding protein
MAMTASLIGRLRSSAFRLSTHLRSVDVARGFTRVKAAAGWLFVGTDTFFTSRHVQLVNLATRRAIPATFSSREAARCRRDRTRCQKFASAPNGGLILTASALSVVHRDRIIALATQHKLPAVYYRRSFAAAGGLTSYGHDAAEQFRGTAGYVARILKGEKPADLPVQGCRRQPSTSSSSISRPRRRGPTADSQGWIAGQRLPFSFSVLVYSDTMPSLGGDGK